MGAKYCPGCGAKGLLVGEVLSLEDIVCEQCQHQYLLTDRGRVTEEELARRQRDVQTPFERAVRGRKPEPVSVTLTRMGYRTMEDPDGAGQKYGRAAYWGGVNTQNV